MDFEDRLRHALAREEPPAGFAAQVMASAARLDRTRRHRWKPWAAGCIAASLLAGTAGLMDLQQRRERQRAQAAHAQLVQALRITYSKLQRIEKKLEGHRL